MSIPSVTEKKQTGIDRLPPHSFEAEQGLIGCILLDPNNVLDTLVNKYGNIGKAMFYDLRHQHIFVSQLGLYEAQSPIDLISVQQRLRDTQLLEQVGGIAYLSQLQDTVPSAANFQYYTDIIIEKFTLRRYLTVCTEVVGEVYDFAGDVQEFSGKVETRILAVQGVQQANEFVIPSMTALTTSVISNIEAAVNSGGVPTGITTGFPRLDSCTDGLHGGEMIIIAARPSMGKTALAMNIAEHTSIVSQIPTGVFSLEMQAVSLTERMLGSQARVNIRSLKRDGFLGQGDSERLTLATGRIGSAKLFIDDTSGLTIMQLRARARRMVKDHGVRLFIIDYLQLVHSDKSGRNDNRERDVADVSSGLKEMAKELNVPVIVLSQLNRESEKTNGKPKLSQLRESGSIEQDADCVFLLYRTDANDEASSQAESDQGYSATLHIAKQRNGPRDVSVLLTYLPQYTRFETQAPDYGIPEPTYTPHNN